MNEMNEINEIKLPKGVDSISVTQHDDKIVIEFIPEKRKFKAGDKVKIKDGISSDTHLHIAPGFISAMDEFIGKELIVKEYSSSGWVAFYGDDYEFQFDKDWLEPWSDEPKKGDLAIFWDDGSEDDAIIKLYDIKEHECHYDSNGVHWDNAIKFESKEQYEKIIKGEG